MVGITWLAGQLLASKELLSSMELASIGTMSTSGSVLFASDFPTDIFYSISHVYCYLETLLLTLCRCLTLLFPPSLPPYPETKYWKSWDNVIVRHYFGRLRKLIQTHSDVCHLCTHSLNNSVFTRLEKKTKTHVKHVILWVNLCAHFVSYFPMWEGHTMPVWIRTWATVGAIALATYLP
jgi:hypothetical protein